MADINKDLDSRDSQFQFMVLNALWVLILMVVFKADFAARRQARHFRMTAVNFGDLYGIQTDKAKQYRREVTYWEPQG